MVHWRTSRIIETVYEAVRRGAGRAAAAPARACAAAAVRGSALPRSAAPAARDQRRAGKRSAAPLSGGPLEAIPGERRSKTGLTRDDSRYQENHGVRPGRRSPLARAPSAKMPLRPLGAPSARAPGASCYDKEINKKGLLPTRPRGGGKKKRARTPRPGRRPRRAPLCEEVGRARGDCSSAEAAAAPRAAVPAKGARCGAASAAVQAPGGGGERGGPPPRGGAEPSLLRRGRGGG
ncbi:unnamed protein product [Prorocentrum cordatum]|uniref:Uncharacterized protein n=1 Tax=Prorocentrum cordatum TaxID=2364126 RepID=A0ABN9VHK5_9DINO|nr:unnamed protein product [Polarella glacialis]